MPDFGWLVINHHYKNHNESITVLFCMKLLNIANKNNQEVKAKFMSSQINNSKYKNTSSQSLLSVPVENSKNKVKNVSKIANHNHRFWSKLQSKFSKESHKFFLK